MTNPFLEGFADTSGAITAGDLTRGDDKIIIIGASVAALVLAAELGKARRRPIYLVVGPPPVTPTLKDGCTLRRGGLACLSEAFAVPAAVLEERLGGEAAMFSGLTVSKLRNDDKLGWPRAQSRKPYRVGLSTRHGHILSTLRGQLHGVQLVAASIDFAAANAGELALRYANNGQGRCVLGANDIVLNTLAQPLFCEALRPARRFVAVVQYPARARTALEPRAYVPYFSDRIAHIGIVSPFADPALSAATHYVLDSTLVSSDKDREAIIDQLDHGAQRYAGALQLDLDASARGDAFVPVVDRFEPLPSRDARVVDLYRPFHNGTPAINADGMLAQASGALSFAKAFNQHGQDRAALVPALARAQRALRSLRFWNRISTQILQAPPLLGDLNCVMMAPSFGPFTNMWANLAAPTSP